MELFNSNIQEEWRNKKYKLVLPTNMHIFWLLSTPFLQSLIASPRLLISSSSLFRSSTLAAICSSSFFNLLSDPANVRKYFLIQLKLILYVLRCFNWIPCTSFEFWSTVTVRAFTLVTKPFSAVSVSSLNLKRKKTSLHGKTNAIAY